MSKKICTALLVLFLAFCSFTEVFAAGSEKLEDLKMRRRFGFGITAGGPLAVFGVEADFNISEDFSLSGGLGTGLDYSTFMVKARYYLMGEWVSPYFAAAFGRWWTDGTSATNIGPAVLKNRFLEGVTDYSTGFSCYFIAPTVGVQFMHPIGFAVSAELQYLFRLFSFSNGVYAGLSAHWYF